MKRRRDNDEQAVGNDSFLDVVSNMVGILIILVAITGIRARNAPVEVAPDAPTAEQTAELAAAESRARSLEGDVRRIAAEMAAVARESAEKFQAREQLAFVVTAVEKELEAQRGKFGGERQADFDAQRELNLAQARVEQLQAQAKLALTPRKNVVRVDNYPTPLSKTVFGKEAHFQLLNGRITFIPIDQLIDAFKADAKQKIWKLKDAREMTDTVGPIGGFRLKYTMQRIDVPLEVGRDTISGGSFAELAQWVLIPTGSEPGETLSDAFTEGSLFRAAMTTLNPKATTVTLWTYPDSFAEFREVKKELYRLGFAIAARPMPDGLPIGGSPQGSKSAAQ